jgi:rhodanese-related sulfurtransferase
LAANFDAEIIVLCHHGIRSADVTRWLITQGWKNTVSLEGGIAAYASEVDKSVGWY